MFVCHAGNQLRQSITFLTRYRSGGTPLHPPGRVPEFCGPLPEGQGPTSSPGSLPALRVARRCSPVGFGRQHHCRPVPEGYVVVGVDEIMPTFEVLKLDYPAGEGDVTELGAAKTVTILWPKECIVLRNPTPRPSSPPPHPSPARSSPPRQP